MFSIRRMQEEHAEWTRRNFGDVRAWRPLLGAVEELGELAHAHLKRRDGIRATGDELDDKARDAVGDIVVFLAGYCTARGFDLEECIAGAWREASKRNWRDHPMTGGSE